MAVAISISHCTPPEPLRYTEVEGRCTTWEPLLRQHMPEVGWDVDRMSKIMWRESRCQPHIRSKTSDTGLLQINRINHRWLTRQLGVQVDSTWLAQPGNNIKAAAALCTFWERRRTTNCYQPWQVQR